MSKYLKPQSPLQHQNGDYIYPITTVDQIIMKDGKRLPADLINVDLMNTVEDTDYIMVDKKVIDNLNAKIDLLSRQHEASLNFLSCTLAGDQTVSGEKTNCIMTWEENESYGDLFELTDNGTSITVKADMIASLHNVLYLYNGYNNGGGIWTRIYINDSEIARSIFNSNEDTTPYYTQNTTIEAINLKANDKITICVYAALNTTAGIIKDYNTTSRLYISVKGIK